jgi:hypothetical protein
MEDALITHKHTGMAEDWNAGNDGRKKGLAILPDPGMIVGRLRA